MTETTSEPILETVDVKKTFHLGFFRKRVDAVRGVTFKVRKGDTFGLLGPNGAGKTTTLKMCLGLVRPTSGEIRVFGKARDREAMKRIGYMPENPYVYQYLTPIEFLDLCGRLMGMDAASRLKRSKDMLARLSLAHAMDRPIGRFSKGMTQRVGLAQAMLHDPEVIILDEPMSGLDPIGRKERREILLEQRKAGKTLIITSHILSDMEMLCDHVAIVNGGRVVANGALRDLLSPDVRRVDIEVARAKDSGNESSIGSFLERTAGFIVSKREHDGGVVVTIEGDKNVGTVLDAATKASLDIVAVTPYRETLEDLFVRNAVRSSAD